MTTALTWIKLTLASLALFFTVGLGSVMLPYTVQAASGASACQKETFFGLIPWYQYLELDPQTCEVKDFGLLPSNGQKSDVPLVLLAVVDDLLRIAGIVAVVYIIYAGIQFIMSRGNPDEAAKARGALINAVVGLAIALIAVALVSFAGRSLGG
jgi:hypothetical protein